jgi:hypothetical protein
MSAELQSKLTTYVRAYLDACETGAVAQGQDALRWTYEVLARLLSEVLEGTDGWTRWSWIDDIIPVNEEILPNELRIDGLVTWSQSDRDMWVEPFFALLLQNSDSVRYELRFGDAEKGLAQIPYGAHRSHIYPRRPDHWLFVFTSSPIVP